MAYHCIVDLRYPIAHPIRDTLRALGNAAQRGICYDAGLALLDAATDPDLARDTIECYLDRADADLGYRIRECDPDLPEVRDRARMLRALVRSVVGPGCRSDAAIQAEVCFLR